MSDRKPLPTVLLCTLNSIIILTWLLTACRATPTPFVPPTTAATSPDGNAASPTASPAPTPTATPVPLALTVNGASITLAEYQASLDRLLAAQPTLSPDQARALALEEFTDQLLLAQAAAQAGFLVDDAMLQERLAQLTAEIGGETALNDWLTANGYTEELFRLELQRAIAAAWMRDQIIARVPPAAEQVRARQILLFSASEAQSVHSQLTGGVAFDLMASFYDPLGLGDLGWFPRGYLTEPAIEEAAFALPPGEFSQVLETSLGYHIIQVLEKDPERPLSPEIRLALQEKALHDWLAEQRTTSQITIWLP